MDGFPSLARRAQVRKDDGSRVPPAHAGPVERPGPAGRRSERAGEDQVSVVKLERVCGGCLGAERRRRTWPAAISSGEVQATFDPEISECGNAMRVNPHDPSDE